MTLKVTKKRLGTSESLTLYTYPKIPLKNHISQKATRLKNLTHFFKQRKRVIFPAILKAKLLLLFWSSILFPPPTQPKELKQRVAKFCEVLVKWVLIFKKKSTNHHKNEFATEYSTGKLLSYFFYLKKPILKKTIRNLT